MVAIACRTEGGSADQASILPTSAITGGISAVAQSCAQRREATGVSFEKTAVSSSPISPIAEKPVISALCVDVTGFLMCCRAAAEIAATTPFYVAKSFKRLG